jgi:hypothetical protein
MSSLNFPTGVERLKEVPVLHDNFSLKALQEGSSDEVKNGLQKLINVNRAYFDQAVVFLTDEKNADAQALINTNGGLSVELVQQVADAIKEQSIKEQKEARLHEAAKNAYDKATSGISRPGK